MNIYQIDEAILALVDEETGEIKDYEAFEALQMERETKIEGTALYVKNLNALAEAMKAEEKSLAERRKSAEAKIARLKQYLTMALGEDDTTKFYTSKVNISFRSSDATEITDATLATVWLESHGYDDCVKYAEPSVDKTEVKKLLKAGVAVEGAELVTRSNIQIR